MSELNYFVGVRLPKGLNDAYHAKCKTLGKQTSVFLRELIEACIENRLTIELKKEQRNLYVGTSNDGISSGN